MAKFILGKKVEMTQKFLEDGTVVPVTVVQAGPCVVTQVKTDATDGYLAVQLGFDRKRKLTKALLGHLQKLGNFRYLREFRVKAAQNFSIGQQFDVTSFQSGDNLIVSALSKGKGFQGVVKRHGFHGQKASHGHKDQERMPGSIGATDSARVFKGTRMGGHMGDEQVTVHNLTLIDLDQEKGLLYIKGAIPGARNSLVRIITEDGDMVAVEKKSEIEDRPAKVEETEMKPVAAEQATTTPTEPLEAPVTTAAEEEIKSGEEK